MEKQKKFGLPKAERICSVKHVEDLFASGLSRFSYPIRMVYRKVEYNEGTPRVQVMFSVPRKRFKLAVKRNLLRRRMREAYRLNKAILLRSIGPLNISIRIAFLYSTNDTCNFADIQDSIIAHLRFLGSTFRQND